MVNHLPIEGRSAVAVSGSRPEEQVVVLVRLGVVASIVVLLAVGDDRIRVHLPAAAVVAAVAVGYGVAVAIARFRAARWPPSWLVSLGDSVLALTICGLTGGADSIAVAVLPLVVIAASLRVGNRQGGLVVAFCLGLGYLVAVVLGTPSAVMSTSVLSGLWWGLYLMATAVLVGVFTRMLERQYEEAAESRAQARAEHDALVEERDLRARLLESQQARHDGLRVLVHEFRTPVTSMSALARELESNSFSEPNRASALSLVSAHAAHLQDMLDGLADLAVEGGSVLGRTRERLVRLDDLARAVLDAAGVPEVRRVIAVRPAQALVWCDPQRLRRVLTNLAENAARCSGSGPVELHLMAAPDTLTVDVLDRGPGLPPDQLGRVTRKYVSLGDDRGTAGLGLWIVEQLVAAMAGTLSLSAREGGGLAARLMLPVRRN